MQLICRKKKNFFRVFLCIGMVAVFAMTGCYSNSGFSEQSSTEVEEIFDNYVYDNEAVISLGIEKMAIAEKGYYYIVNGLLYFYDIESGLGLPLCSRVDCKHKDNQCDAYANPSGSSDISCLCDGGEVFYYEKKLYMVERDTENNYYLSQYNSNYNEKKYIAKLSSLSEDGTIVSSNGAYTICNGHFYYYAYEYDYDKVETDYMFDFNCMRVKLEVGATPEKLGEFVFAGDYGTAAGGGNSTTVLVSGDNIYYFAGGCSRMWKKDNPMQCRISKYNTKTGEFTEVLSYTGEVSNDAWSKDVGKIGFIDDSICMDGKDTVYALIRKGGFKDNSVYSFNIQQDIQKNVYTTPYDEVKNLVFDGNYLYFIEVDYDGGATYLTAIDTEGNLINRFLFEFSDEYKKEISDRNILKGEQVTGEISLYGVDGRYIMFGATDNVYKNLSQDSYDYVYPKTYGVGILNKELFISNKEVSIKQIK